jgi:hypothetical protein
VNDSALREHLTSARGMLEQHLAQARQRKQ